MQTVFPGEGCDSLLVLNFVISNKFFDEYMPVTRIMHEFIKNKLITYYKSKPAAIS